MAQSVRFTPEVHRILALPRRKAAITDALVDELTEALKRKAGTQRLFPVQALALLEAMLHGGVVGNIDVGEGKTLITFLIAHVLEAKRFLLLLPSKLIEKTIREHEAYAKHWHVTPLENIKILSYESLGRISHETAIEDYQPDLIGGDEIHRVKDRRASCTKRVIKYMRAHPETRFVGFSGTLMSKSITDFAHIVRWALKDGSPVPATVAELEAWAWALDDKLDESVRWDPGALLKFCEPEDIVEGDSIATARKGFRRRLLETPGIVSTLSRSDDAKCSLYISPFRTKYEPITEEYFERLRSTWTLPNGQELILAADVWRHAREMALGFYYVWDPAPPKAWLDARRDWQTFAREVLSRSRTYDSEEHLAKGVREGKVSDGGLLARWRLVQSTFRINQKAVWFDDSALHACAEWMHANPDGIVWVEHIAFGERLAAVSGRKYYGAEGLSADGELLSSDVAPGPVIASIRANSEGRNLQRWCKNLVTSPPDEDGLCQQLIGRTHRRGQTADEVTVEIFLTCREHASSFRHAMSGAVALRDTLGAKPKLLLADVDWPSDSELNRLKGARWKYG